MDEILLSQQRMLQDMQRINASVVPIQGGDGPTPHTSFSGILDRAINHVNEAQGATKKIQQDFETGSGNVSLQDVTFAMHKSNMAFQLVSQMRNRWISAYQEIMSIQI